jgi:hypothetical protein
VDAVLRVDEASRTVWFTGMGRESGDPYFHYLYKASLDGGEPVLLTRERADHKITLSPDGTHFLDVLSTVDAAPVALVRATAPTGAWPASWPRPTCLACGPPAGCRRSASP